MTILTTVFRKMSLFPREKAACACVHSQIYADARRSDGAAGERTKRGVCALRGEGNRRDWLGSVHDP